MFLDFIVLEILLGYLKGLEGRKRWGEGRKEGKLTERGKDGAGRERGERANAPAC